MDLASYLNISLKPIIESVIKGEEKEPTKSQMERHQQPSVIKEELEDDDHDESMQHTLRKVIPPPRSKLSTQVGPSQTRHKTVPKYSDESMLNQRKASINSNRSNHNASIKSESQRMIEDLYNKSQDRGTPGIRTEREYFNKSMKSMGYSEISNAFNMQFNYLDNQS
jgi:hypothetical protein